MPTRKSRRSKSGPKKDSDKKKKPQGASTLAAVKVGMPSQLQAVFNNPTASTKEMVVTLVDFFESPKETVSPYQQFQLDLKNMLGFNAGSTGAASPLARVTKFELFALPRSINADVAAATLAVLFGLPVNAGTGGTAGATAAVKTTILTPTSVLDWVLVGSWNENTITSTAQQLISGSNGLTVLGTFAVFNPDDWTPVADPLQYMAKVTIAQALPSYFTVMGAVPTAISENAYSSVTGSEATQLGLMAESVATRKTE